MTYNTLEKNDCQEAASGSCFRKNRLLADILAYIRFLSEGRLQVTCPASHDCRCSQNLVEVTLETPGLSRQNVLGNVLTKNPGGILGLDDSARRFLEITLLRTLRRALRELPGLKESPGCLASPESEWIIQESSLLERICWMAECGSLEEAYAKLLVVEKDFLELCL